MNWLNLTSKASHTVSEGVQFVRLIYSVVRTMQLYSIGREVGGAGQGKSGAYNEAMKYYKDIFMNTGVTQSIGGMQERIDENNATIDRMELADKSVRVYLRHISNGNEGMSRLRVREEFKDKEEIILEWASQDERLKGCTLNQIRDLDVPVI